MIRTKLLMAFILAVQFAFTSCQSDSDKMIEKCNAHIAALDSVQTPGDFESFANTHRNGLRELVMAAKKDSIYAQQDLTEAMPQIFNAIYKHTEKQEWALVRSNPATLGEGLMTLIGVYTFRLPFCTSTSQLEQMMRNLNQLSMPLFTKYQPTQFEMTVLRLGNEWVQSSNIRKAEIENGNLYSSQFLK